MCAKDLFVKILLLVESGDYVLDDRYHTMLLPIAGGGYIGGPIGAAVLVLSCTHQPALTEDQLHAEALKYGLTEEDLADIRAGFVGEVREPSEFYRVGRKLKLSS